MTPGSRSSGSRRPAPEHVAAQRVVDREDRGVADRQPGLPQRLGHPRRREVAGPAARAGPAPPRRRPAAASHAVTPPGPAARATPGPPRRRDPAARAATGPARGRGRGPRRARAGRACPPTVGTSVTRSISRVGNPCPRTTSRVGVAPRSRAASRAAAATPLTVGTVITSRRSQRATTSTTRASLERGRSTTTRSWPRLAAESASRTANGCTEPLGPGGQVSTPRPSRRGTASCNERALSRPVVCCSASQRTPSRCSSPRTRSRPGPSGSRSTTIADTAAGPDLAERAGEGRRPGPAAAAHHAHDPAQARRPVARVGEHLDQPRLRARQLGDALGAHGRATANRSSGTGPATTTWVASRRPGRSRAISRGHVGAEEDQRRGRPGGQRVGHRAAHPGRHTGRRGEPEQLVEQRRVSGDHQGCAHAVEAPAARAGARAGRRTSLGTPAVRSVACGHPPGRSAPGTPAALLR